MSPTDGRPRLGVVFDRSYPADAVVDYARRAENAGLDELWFIEDCFFTGGVSLSAAALAVTDRIGVGLGVMPAVARTAPITAMEVATLAGIGAGRFTAGIGHGVQSWMQQMGVRTPSPLTTLDETISTVVRLLDGDEVTFDGTEVRLDHVQLEQPPDPRPLVLAGVQRERSLALAGRVADGLILVEGAGPTYVRWALERAARGGETRGHFRVVTFTIVSIAGDRRDARRPIAGFVADLVREQRPTFRVLPFWEELGALVADGGADALIDAPQEWWHEIGAVGTADDAAAHLDAIGAAGVDVASGFPGPDLDDGHSLIDEMAALRSG